MRPVPAIDEYAYWCNTMYITSLLVQHNVHHQLIGATQCTSSPAAAAAAAAAADAARTLQGGG
jgi:hypothetical protein